MATGSVMELNINEKAHGYAKIYASLLKDAYQRKRAYASLVALYALVDALEKTDNSVQKSMTLFRNPVLNEQYEISDLYINNWHIDVRVMTDGDAVLVPKTHYDNDILPDFYAVVKVDKALQKAELIGFVETSKTEKQAYDYHYSSISLSSLISYDEFLTKICNPKSVDFEPQEHEMFRELYLSLMDEEMKPEIKNKLLKHLFNCPQCRTEFCCFTGFEMVNCNMGSYPNLFDDMTLNIVGAQDVDNAKYAGMEQTIYIGDDDAPAMQDEPVANTKYAEKPADDVVIKDIEPEAPQNEVGVADDSEEKEMTVSDILDELFGVEEGFIEPETVEEKTAKSEEELEAEAFEKAVEEKVKEVEGKPAFEEDEPLDLYEEIPLDGSEPIPAVKTVDGDENSVPSNIEKAEDKLEDTIEELPDVVEEVPTLVDEPQIIEEASLINDEETILETTTEEPVINIETETILNISEDMQVIEEDSSVINLTETEEMPFEIVGTVEEESADEALEIIETNEELEVIDENLDENLTSVDIDDAEAVDVISSDIDDEIEPTFELHEDVDDELEIIQESEKLIQEATSDAQENIQKVIVDYDETGEPIYSYITNVTQDAQLITDEALDESDYDILNEQFDTYPQETSDDLNYEINNASVRPVEYVSESEPPAFEEWKDDETTDVIIAEKALDEELASFDDMEENSDVPEFEEYKEEDTSAVASDDADEFEEYVDDIASPSVLDDEFEEYKEEDDNVVVVPSIGKSAVKEDDYAVEYETEVPDEEKDVDSNFNEDLDSETDVEEDEEYEDEDPEDEEYDDEEYEEDDEEDMKAKKKSSPLIILFVLLLFLVAGGAGAFFFLKNKNEDANTTILPENAVNNIEAPVTMPQEAEEVTDMFGATESNNGLEVPSSDTTVKNDAGILPPPPPVTSDNSNVVNETNVLTEKKLLKEQRNKELNKSIASAFTNGGNRATLRSVNWLCAPQMFTDSIFKSYMQELDNILKLNLRKNILDATETPQNNNVIAKMAIDKNGDLNKVVIAESSGSQQIDNIVLQSINETFEGKKTYNLNDSALKQDMYYLKLVIKL